MIFERQLIGSLSISACCALTTAAGQHSPSPASVTAQSSVTDGSKRIDARLSIGLNLSTPTYYSAEMPFRDAFMLSSHWFHQTSNTTNPWDLGGLEVTNDGWPILQRGRGARPDHL